MVGSKKNNSLSKEYEKNKHNSKSVKKVDSELLNKFKKGLKELKEGRARRLI